jgi:hypothetical protein
MEAPVPIAVAENRDRGMSVFVGGNKGSARRRRHSEGGEKVAAHLVGFRLLRRIAKTHRGLAERERHVRDDIGEHRTVFPSGFPQAVVDVNPVRLL